MSWDIITLVCGLFLKWEVWFSYSPGWTSSGSTRTLWHVFISTVLQNTRRAPSSDWPYFLSFPGRILSLCTSPQSRCFSIPHLQPGVGIAERANPQSGINMGILEPWVALSPTVYENIINFSVLHESRVESSSAFIFKGQNQGGSLLPHANYWRCKVS